MSSVKNTRVNKSFRRRASFFVFSPEHIIPFGLSLTFGFMVVGVGLQANFIWVMVSTCIPFVTWLIVAGKDPARTFAKYLAPPAWRRGRGRHNPLQPLKRRPTPAVTQQVITRRKKP